MATIFGTEKKVATQRNLYVGVVTAIPIAFNPTNEELSIITKGAKNFEKPINYKFESALGESYKFDIWCKFSYVKDELGNLVCITDKNNSPEVVTEYVCYSFWGDTKQDIFYHEDGSIKGTWYVNSVTCGMEWVPQGDVTSFLSSRNKTALDYSLPTTYIATKGEKDLFQFLAKWLMIEEINFNTKFINIIRGNYKEVNDLIKSNLNRTDRNPRGVKLFLGIKSTSDANYQSVYSMVMPESQNYYTALHNSLGKRTWGDNKAGGDYTFRIYSDMPTSNETVERIPTSPTQGW